MELTSVWEAGPDGESAMKGDQKTPTGMEFAYWTIFHEL